MTDHELLAIALFFLDNPQRNIAPGAITRSELANMIRVAIDPPDAMDDSHLSDRWK